MRCTKQKTFLPIVVLLCFCNAVWAQFAPAADLAGTTAIYKDSSAFTEWATGCIIQRGPMNIANPSLGLATAGDSTAAIGPAGQNGTVSLGDGGVAILSFDHAIFNGAGFDFAVFENGFMTNDSNMAFLELAFVEVSTDGVRYVRFPATTDVQNYTQLGNGGYMDCSEVNNLAGKYTAGYGTPFDLAELVDSPGIDVATINYIKLIDVVGSIDNTYATYDHNGNKVNDPWPTPFASSGFDLDAVGAIHANGLSGIQAITDCSLKMYPNPAHLGDAITVQLPEDIQGLRLFDISGQLITELSGYKGNTNQTISTGALSGGIYFITAETAAGRFNTKLIVE